MLKLIKAQKEYLPIILNAIDEFEKDTTSYTKINPIKHMITAKKENDFDSYFAKIIKDEEPNQPIERVRQTIFWLIDDDQYIGTFALRHSLNDALRQIGGNIAYQILPSKQGKKYAQKGLELCIAEAKKLGLEKVLITCDEDNIASYKVIYNTLVEMSGVEGVKSEIDGKNIYRAWIHTTKRRNNTIRPLAIAVIKKDNKILAMTCYDKKKDEVFYRLPGGGIDFAETATQALSREFQEELGIDVAIIKKLPTYENIFIFEGKQGHEIILPFEATLSPENMAKDKIKMIEEEFEERYMEFVEITPDKKIYPPVF